MCQYMGRVILIHTLRHMLESKYEVSTQVTHVFQYLSRGMQTSQAPQGAVSADSRPVPPPEVLMVTW